MDAADLRRLGARRTIIDRRKSQQAPGLRAVLRLPRQASQPRRLEIPAQWYRNLHGEPSSFATLNQNRADFGIVGESQFLRFGMRHWLRSINIMRRLVAISGLI